MSAWNEAALEAVRKTWWSLSRATRRIKVWLIWRALRVGPSDVETRRIVESMLP